MPKLIKNGEEIDLEKNKKYEVVVEDDYVEIKLKSPDKTDQVGGIITPLYLLICMLSFLRYFDQLW